MERSISYPLYAAAFVLSVLVFSIGVYVGYLIDQSNQASISKEVEDISRKVESTQLLMLLEDNSSSFCPLYKSQLDSINEEVENIGYRLSYLEEEKNVYDVPLKKNYFVLEAQSYLLSKKIKERCGDKSVLLIYFYSNANCSSCKDQGDGILQVRDELRDRDIIVKIFSFDGDLGSPVADALKTQFSVSTYPSIIVDGKLYSGMMSREKLQSVLSGG